MSSLHRTSLQNLLTSKLFDEHSFYEAFIHDLRRSKTEVIIESPYITCRRVNQLLPILKKLIKHGVKVTINTRNPQHHDELLRIQAYMAFKILKPRCFKVITFNDYHHRKIAVIDGRILYEGSLNILSQYHSCEIMRRIESEELNMQMINFLGLRRFY
jgi:phosphatidylserine/phosphatidylglycerophosphate/cardiolipin synthase-like enzyme